MGDVYDAPDSDIYEKQFRKPVSIKSFGFRHGLTIDGKIVFSPNPSKQHGPVQYINGNLIADVRRILPKNPYHNKKLRQLRGDDDAVIRELEHTPGIHKAYHSLRELVSKHTGPVYIGCTGGHHRSVYIANRLGKDLGVPVEHLNYTDK